MGCAFDGDPVAANHEALTGGAYDFVDDPDEQAGRDAVVALQAGCAGTLVTPRLVLTAWHCVGGRAARPGGPGGPTFVVFGADYTAVPDSRRVPIIECQPFPGARTDGVTPTCNNFPYRVLDDGSLGYDASLRWPFDVALIVLDQRIDAVNRPDGYPAIPIPVALTDPDGDPSRWFTPDPWPVRYVSVLNLSTPARPIRVTATGLHIRGAFGDAFDIERGPYGYGPGDSGGPYLTDRPGEAPRLVTVFNLNPRLSHPEVSAWLRPLVEPIPGSTEGFLAGTYVGSSDVPSRFNPARRPIHDFVDPDGDGLIDAHDNCPRDANEDQLDSDLDGVGNACDNCPFARGPQRDTDHDGVGDVCDPCPNGCTIEGLISQEDADRDGRGDCCDNCPTVSNRRQDDCNFDAIDAIRADEIRTLGRPVTPILGDACDPDPCGETRIAAREALVPFRRTDVLYTFHDEVLIDGRRAPSATVQLDFTGFRFCRCEHASADAADVRSLCQAADEGGCLLNQIDRYESDRQRLTPEGVPWRWFTVAPTSSVPGDPLTERAVTYHMAGPEDPFTPEPRRAGEEWHHHLFDVAPRWAAAPLTDPPEHIPSGPGASGAWNGLIWTATTAQLRLGSDRFTRDERMRRSHYWSGTLLAPAPVPSYPVPPREAIPCIIPRIPFPVSDRTCAACAARFPEPFLGFAGTSTLRFCLDFVPGTPALAFGSRLVLPTETIPIPPLDQLFRAPADARWLAPAEPIEWLTDATLRFVALDASLGVAVKTLVERDGALQDAKPIPCPNCLIAPLASVARDPEAPPEGLEEPAIVLSARHEAVWVMGGTLAGRPYTGIHVFEVGAERWSRIGTYWASGDGLGRVLAATYSPADDRLYALDEVREGIPAAGHALGMHVPEGGTRMVRLLAIDPSLGRPRALASWERRTDHDTFGLAADVSGRLYAVASRHSAGVHALARLAPDASGTWTAEAFAFGVGGYLPAGAHANDRGVSFAVGGPAGPRVIGYEASELGPARGGAERCF